MKLSDYISDLLYRYDCVIVPDFGGFIANRKPAVISAYSNTFYPPHKLITFNNYLKNNDGLLANYISRVDKMPYEYALNFIKFEVEQWREELKDHDIELQKIGKLSLENNGSLSFEPQTELNYLTEAFGLGPVISQEIKRETYVKEVEKIEEKVPVIIAERKKPTNEWLKYAAIFAVIAAIGLTANSFYQKHLKQQRQVVLEEKKKELDLKIEKATFVVTEALPSITMNVELEKLPFHVIAGAFRYPENAKRKVNQLIAQGYNARILGVNRWGLTMVSFDSYDNERDATNNLYKIQRTVSPDAWLLIQDL